jgi:hypothetical protein
VVNAILWPVYHREEPQYHCRKVASPRVNVDGFWQRENPLRPPGIEPQAVHPVGNSYILKCHFNIILISIPQGSSGEPFIPTQILKKSGTSRYVIQQLSYVTCSLFAQRQCKYGLPAGIGGVTHELILSYKEFFQLTYTSIRHIKLSKLQNHYSSLGCVNNSERSAKS